MVQVGVELGSREQQIKDVWNYLVVELTTTLFTCPYQALSMSLIYYRSMVLAFFSSTHVLMCGCLDYDFSQEDDFVDTSIKLFFLLELVDDLALDRGAKREIVAALCSGVEKQ